jgi:hypothetical protein
MLPQSIIQGYQRSPSSTNRTRYENLDILAAMQPLVSCAAIVLLERRLWPTMRARTRKRRPVQRRRMRGLRRRTWRCARQWRGRWLERRSSLSLKRILVLVSVHGDQTVRAREATAQPKKLGLRSCSRSGRLNGDDVRMNSLELV